MLHPCQFEKNILVVFTKKNQDLPGVPKKVKNDPEIFQNSWSILIVI